MAKKKFRDTVVGKLLIGAVGIVNPALGSLISGATNVTDAVKNIIADGTLTGEQKEHFKQMAHELEIQEFEAEVKDRESARAREVGVLNAGGTDIMFKVVGAGVMIIWGLLIYGIFFSDFELEGLNKDLAMVAFGGVSVKMGHIVSYYFGSSIGSKQKTQMLKQ